jgi:hypothetical protein
VVSGSLSTTQPFGLMSPGGRGLKKLEVGRGWIPSCIDLVSAGLDHELEAHDYETAHEHTILNLKILQSAHTLSVVACKQDVNMSSRSTAGRK